jgi:hypothetical protein
VGWGKGGGERRRGLGVVTGHHVCSFFLFSFSGICAMCGVKLLDTKKFNMRSK